MEGGLRIKVKKWNLIIDVAKCHDCNNCFLACKDEFFENDFAPFSLAQPRHGQRWMNIMRKERGTVSQSGCLLFTPALHALR